jgi:hypothetical protein
MQYRYFGYIGYGSRQWAVGSRVTKKGVGRSGDRAIGPDYGGSRAVGRSGGRPSSFPTAFCRLPTASVLPDSRRRQSSPRLPTSYDQSDLLKSYLPRTTASAVVYGPVPTPDCRPHVPTSRSPDRPTPASFLNSSSGYSFDIIWYCQLRKRTLGAVAGDWASAPGDIPSWRASR